MTRVRGFAPWRPQAKTCVLLAQVATVLDAYADHLPLTARQVFYRLVGTVGYDKTEDGYNRLTEVLNRGRRVGLVAWDAIRDDGVRAEEPVGFTGKADYWDTVADWAGQYRRDRQAGQPVAVEAWVEAAGMVPQVARVAQRYGAAVYSSGGFDSTTAKHDAAQRVAGRNQARWCSMSAASTRLAWPYSPRHPRTWPPSLTGWVIPAPSASPEWPLRPSRWPPTGCPRRRPSPPTGEGTGPVARCRPRPSTLPPWPASSGKPSRTCSTCTSSPVSSPSRRPNGPS